MASPIREALRERGWIEGQTVAIVYLDAEGNPNRFQALAAELVQLKVDVIVVAGPSAIHAAQEATDTVVPQLEATLSAAGYRWTVVTMEGPRIMKVKAEPERR